MDSAGPIDWSTALRGWTFADVLTAFEALPESLQQPLHAALTTAPKPVPPPAPWAVAGGSVSWLLDELGLSGLYGSTFAEYGVETVAQMLGPEGGDPSALIASLRELGVTRDHRDKIERLARSPRPCGASGSCFDRAFLAACRPLHAQHMGCENMGPLLYSLVRFTKAQGGGRAGGRADTCPRRQMPSSLWTCPSRGAMTHGRGCALPQARHVLEVGAGYTSVWILQAALPAKPRSPSRTRPRWLPDRARCEVTPPGPPGPRRQRRGARSLCRRGGNRRLHSRAGRLDGRCRRGDRGGGGRSGGRRRCLRRRRQRRRRRCRRRREPLLGLGRV